MGCMLAIVLATLCADVTRPRPPWLPPATPAGEVGSAVYRLRPDGEGYVYDDPRFQAHIARDGVVSFKDKRVSAALAFPLLDIFKKGAGPGGPTLESTVRDFLSKGKRRKPAPQLEPSPPPHPQKLVQPEVCPPNSSCHVPPLPNAVELRGSFDLTDEIMRSLHQDPYAYEKARFLSSTFEMRIAMAIAARKADLRASLESLPGRLEELLGDERYSPRERRRILYELWYETDETPEGVRAARLIEDLIRRRLPCGSAQGYAPEELDRLRKLHPDRPFSPVADCPAAEQE